jgi:hypothetical protein
MSKLQKSWMLWATFILLGGGFGAVVQGKQALEAFASAAATTAGVLLGLMTASMLVMLLIDKVVERQSKLLVRATSKGARMVLDGSAVKCPMCGATWAKSAIPEGLKSHV